MPAPDENKHVKSEQVEVPVRELTQTDHLNKKLLTSLFKRIEEDSNSTLSKMLEPEDTENNDEWKD